MGINKTTKILSPAKINLMLRILGQRKDGYHLLQTYFQLLNWGDIMQFQTTQVDKIKRTGQFDGLPQESNLIYKATQLLIPHRKQDKGIHIAVEKNIPQGSGLGGGSSNAGVTLRILNKLWECHLSQQQLQNMAVQLGADVPVFVLNQSAIASGIGEQLKPHKLTHHYFVLIFPKTSISTAEVFSHKDLVRNQKEISPQQIQQKEYWTNSCLPVVLKNFPELAEKYHIATKIAPVYMSGTGSTLFCCFDFEHEARQFIELCPSDWNTQICQDELN